MSVKTVISGGYRARLGVIGLVLIGFGIYCLYDGFIAYPEKQRMQIAFAELKKDSPDDWAEKWRVMSAENGWSEAQPEAPMSDLSIYTQFIMAGITLPFGLYFGGLFLLSGGRFVEADEKGIRSNKVSDVSWDDVKSVDSSRWQSKGIAVVHYERASGAGVVTLDDWKFEREPTQEIYSMVANHLGVNVDEEDVEEEGEV
ncbi:hypothetical protein [Poriferisphaera sp. WC338]|uniref:hypothetical protein n=1 Tax=Poriferisphaera sp. WC338 TaxID=3425129 RepID=UPI003D814907